MPFVHATAADADLPVTAHFSVYASAEPGVMPRVLELFAKRGLVPTVWHSAIAGGDRAQLTIDIDMREIGRELVRYIASCLQQIADVEAVLTAEREATNAGRQPG